MEPSPEWHPAGPEVGLAPQICGARFWEVGSPNWLRSRSQVAFKRHFFWSEPAGSGASPGIGPSSERTPSGFLRGALAVVNVPDSTVLLVNPFFIFCGLAPLFRCCGIGPRTSVCVFPVPPFLFLLRLSSLQKASTPRVLMIDLFGFLSLSLNTRFGNHVARPCMTVFTLTLLLFYALRRFS